MISFGEIAQSFKYIILSRSMDVQVDDIKKWIREEPKREEETTHHLIDIGERRGAKKIKKILLSISLTLFLLALILVYLIQFSSNCNNLQYLYSNLEKCSNKSISLTGVAFTDSFDYPEQGNPFYMESNGYLIDVRGLSKVKSGEKISLKGILVTYPIVFLNVTEGKKEEVIEEYRINEICRKKGVVVDKIKKFNNNGRLFITNLTLLNFLVYPIKDKFIYKLQWSETPLNSFTVLDSNVDFEINKSYEICGILLPIGEGVLRVFWMK